jgi:nucleoside-diphosphate-sugar epimerase
MRVLLIGGTRLVGPPLVRELVAAGHEVTVFHRGQTEAALPASVRHVHGDVAQFLDHVEELKRAEPEVVVDLIAYREEEGRRVHLFKDVARRAVVLSSADVYRAFNRLFGIEDGPADPVPLTEDSPLREKLSVQGEKYNKTGVERAARDRAPLPVTILRLPAIHGPGDFQHRQFSMIKRIDDGRPAILMDEREADWKWTRGYVENLAWGVALAVMDDRAAGRTYNVADQPVLTQYEWARRVADAAGYRGKILRAPTAMLPEALRCDIDPTAQQYEMDSSRIVRELGYGPRVSVDEGLRRTIAWERANPPETIDPKKFDYAAEDEALSAMSGTAVD